MQKSLLIFLLTALFLTLGAQASDCCADYVLPPIAQGEEAISLEDACAQFKSFDPDFTCVPTSSRVCTNPRVDKSQYYLLKFFGQYFLEIELGNDEFQGNRLLDYLPITKLASERLAAIKEANKALENDLKEVEKEFGVKFYSPSALPIHIRCPYGATQLLYMGMETYGNKTYSSCEMINRDFWVKISEIVPKRENYDDAVLYQKGDLLTALGNAPALFKKCQAVAKNNAKIISDSLSHSQKPGFAIDQQRKEKWDRIADNYKKIDCLKQ